MLKVLQVKLITLLMISLLVSMGCTVGVKQKNSIVMNDPIPLPESAKGAVRIATNEPVKLSVDGIADKVFTKNIGGYVVVVPGWYAALVDCWNKNHP